MFTNEQAIEIIKQHEECYVVWATDKNLIVAVHPVPRDAMVNDRLHALTGMSTDYRGPTMGRFLNSAETTLQTLNDETKEIDFGLRRRAIFNSWTACSIDDLIEILVNANFVEPMDARHGSSHIVERLYKIHGSRLSNPQLLRLRAFAYSENVDPEQECAQQSLQCYLSVLCRDGQALKDFWSRHHCPDVDWSSWEPFTEAAGDLPTNDEEIIAQLISMVQSSVMFGPRHQAMLALGKIGSPAGQKASQVIAASIYDSSDRITAERNRVIERIETPAEFWAPCPQCFHGYVNLPSHYGITSVEACQHCLGIGHVPRTVLPTGYART